MTVLSTEIKRPRPTDEQEEIIKALKTTSDNICINALAGTGKSTTLEFINDASPVSPVLYLVFNKDARDKAERLFPGTTVIRTFNGLGDRICRATFPSIILDKKKMQDLFREEISDLKGQDRKDAWDEYWPILTAIQAAKSLGYVPEGKFAHARRLIYTEDFYASLEDNLSPFARDLTDTLLSRSIVLAYKGRIDFNDQIYMPALFTGTFPRFPLTLIDEVQDLNPVNHAMLEKLCKDRIVIVGDDAQSIYGFRGAVHGGMAKLKTKYKMVEKTISYSFRCPEEVVKSVHWRVPEFKWTKEGGKVEEVKNLTFQSIPEGAMVLCRNNAPLFKTAMKLLQHGRSVQIAGSDIGPKIIRLLEKLAAPDTPQDMLYGMVEDWRAERLVKTNAPKSTNDIADCMLIFVGWGKTLSQAVSYCKHMFAQQGTIHFSTVHKSKGGGWPVVYLLDPWLIGDDDQELNIRYVAHTRSADQLYLVDSGDIFDGNK